MDNVADVTQSGSLRLLMGRKESNQTKTGPVLKIFFFYINKLGFPCLNNMYFLFREKSLLGKYSFGIRSVYKFSKFESRD